MNMRDLVPWSRNERGRALASGTEPESPFLTLHREMNRLFDDAFRGFGASDLVRGARDWPSLEVEERDREYRVTAELPGMEERDVEVTYRDGLLSIRGEKRSETEDRSRAVSERWYGRFERQLALRDVDESGAQASFRNGVLTVLLPKAEGADSGVKRIPINAQGKAH